MVRPLSMDLRERASASGIRPQCEALPLPSRRLLEQAWG